MTTHQDPTSEEPTSQVQSHPVEPELAGTALAPVGPTERILGIDAARGFALLGIFLVNVMFHTGTIGAAIDYGASANASVPDTIGWWIVACLFMEKTFPLFSLLFGIGLAIQIDRARDRGLSATGLQVKRLLILLVFGLCHAILIWFGDILAMYAVIGLIGIFLLRLPAQKLLLIGCAIIAFAAVQAFLISMLMAPSQAPEPIGLDPTSEKPAVAQLFDAMKSGKTVSPDMQIWMDAETSSFRDGGFGNATAMRGLNYMAYLFMTFFGGMQAQILGLMCLGGALLRLGLFDGRAEKVRRALLYALPLAIGASVVIAIMLNRIGYDPSHPNTPPLAGARILVGSLQAAGYLALFATLARLAAAAMPIGWFAAAGRLSLTNYLLQSVIATGVAYHWGLAKFGTLAPAEQFGLALGVYIVQIVLSVLWLSRFRIGPMEWLWRTLSYGKPQGVLRKA